MPLFKAILFDLDHTLCIDHNLEVAVLRRFVERERGTAPSEEDAAYAFARFRDDHMPLDDALEEAFRRWGLANEHLSQWVRSYEDEVVVLAPDYVEPLPRAQPTIAELVRRGVSVAIFTNGWARLQRRKGQIIDFPGPVLTSEDLKAWKPDAGAFKLAAQKLDFPLAQTLYVGDSPQLDIAGAKSAGMYAAWINQERKTYPPGLAVPDFTLSALDELVAIAAARG